MSMPNATDLAVSTLPALSVERNWTVCWPSASTVTSDANGFAPAVLVAFVQAPSLSLY